MADVPRLTDGVVVLDAFTFDDLDAHVAGEDDEQARRLGWYPEHSTEATARAAFLRWDESWKDNGKTRAFATRTTTGELVGGCEIRLREDRVGELSYWTFPPHRRKGYTSRAIRLASEFAFAQLEVERLEAHVEPDNAGSRRALETARFLEGNVIRVTEQTVSGKVRDLVLIVYGLARGDPSR